MYCINVRTQCTGVTPRDCTPPLYGMIVRQHCPHRQIVHAGVHAPPWFSPSFLHLFSNSLTPREFLFKNSPSFLFRKILNYKNLYSGFPEKFWHSKVSCAGHTFSPKQPTSSHFTPQYISNVHQRASKCLCISTPMKVQNSTKNYSILYNRYN